MSREEHLSPIKEQNINKYKNFSEKTASEQMRIVRGYAIISKGDTPKEIAKETYTIPSQSGNGEYTITKNSGWKCNCPDFENRHKDCKHIHAIKFFLELKRKVEYDSLEVEEITEKPKCIYCNSSDVVKFGKRKCRERIKQLFRCNDCRKYFIQNKDFEKMKGDEKTTTLILDLYFKGISLRQIKDHLKQFYNLSIDHSNILRRIQKFSKIMNEYVKTLKPELSNTWHIDEMKIQAGGKWKWLWNMMDNETKFIVSQKVTDRRKIRDCRNLLRNSKEISKEPEFMITDGCHSYERSLKREMPQTNHVQLKSIRDHVNNNPIERLNGSIRDRVKVMRGMQNLETADLMMSAYRNYYNFIRPHSAIGTTPAIKSGIDLELGNNRWLGLLKQSLK